MKKRFIMSIVVAALLISSSGSAKTWIGWYTGPWDEWYNDSAASAIIQTSDGGFAVVGSCNSCENSPYCMYGYVCKLSATGQVLWSHLFGDSENPSTYLYDLTETSDGGIAVIGSTGTDQISVVDVLVAKFSASGTVIWQRVYGSTEITSNSHWPSSIYGNSDGSISAVPTIPDEGSKNIYHLLLNGSSGSIISETKLSGGSYSSFYRGYKISDGFIALPTTFYKSISKYGLTVQRFSEDGSLEWSKAYFAKDSSDNLIQLYPSHKMIAECEGGYIICRFSG